MSDQYALLRNQIDRADAAYYRTGTAIMPDAEYDLLKRNLRDLCPDDERLTRVGAPYSDEEIGTKVKHSIPMGSLDNTDDGILGVADWYNKLAGKLGKTPSLVVSHKVDGSSVALEYVDGVFVRAITRGDGRVGEDITANARTFKSVPSRLPQPLTCTVRGEAVLPKADFEQLTKDVPDGEKSNARNVGNGIIGRENGVDSDLIIFYAFNVVVHAPNEWYDALPRTESFKLYALTSLFFNVVLHWECELDEVNAVYEAAFTSRSTLQYGIDGLVIALDDLNDQDKFVTKDPKTRLRPKYARAIKWPSQVAVTKVTGVTVTVGHNGVIVPTLNVERVRLGGIFCDSVIVNNFDEIERHDVAVGDIVEVCLAGDIIPNLSRVITRASTSDEPIYQCPGCDFQGTAAAHISHHTH